MPRLSKEERAELERKLQEDDDFEDDFEVEIRNDTGASARVPYRKGKSWLQKNFGIDLDPDPGDDDSDDADDKKPAAKKEPDTVRRFAGRRIS